MAREINIVNKPAQGRIDPSSVPADVAEDIEATFAALADKQDAVITFGDKAELDLFLKQARTYCESRTPALTFRKSPRKGSPANVLYFTVKIPAAAT
jgi:hypothetical protein